MKNLKNWVGAGADIDFVPEDFDILDVTISIFPELRICAQVLKLARQEQVEYPIVSINSLTKLMPDKTVRLGGHIIDAAAIKAFMPDDHLPILDEGDLVSKTYMALLRCKAKGSESNPSFSVPN